jgi:RND family efflux transporter MFP subunit
LELHSRKRAAAIVLSGVLAVSCGSAPDEAEPEPAEVPTITAETAKVERQPVADTLDLRGVLVALPNQDVKVSALVPGRVNAVAIAEGDTVSAGQVIAQIDPRPLQEQLRQAQAALKQAEAQVENARLNLQRTQQMFDRGIAAGKEVEDARTAVATAAAAVEQANAGVNTAALQAERADVRSPIAGQVVKRSISVGEQVDGTAAEPIAEIANVDPLELSANVPVEQLSKLAVGQPATVTSVAVPDKTFTGSIVAISPAVDPATSAGSARIRIPNREHQLKVGMFAVAHLKFHEHAALIVPHSALVRNDEGAAVYVVSGNIAQRTAVTTGIETTAVVEIVSGVEEGQTVLTSGVYGLSEKALLAK